MKKYSKLYNSKVFCMMPWIHTHVWPSGNAFPCCMSDITVVYGNLPKHVWKVMYILMNDSIEIEYAY